MIVLKLVLISAGLMKLKIKCSLIPWFLNYIIWIQMVLRPSWKLGPSVGLYLVKMEKPEGAEYFARSSSLNIPY